MKALIYLTAALFVVHYGESTIDEGSLRVYLNSPGVSNLQAATVSLSNPVRSTGCRSEGARVFVCAPARFGWYTLQVVTPGFRTVTVPARIYSHQVAVRVGLTIGGEDSGPISTLSGRVTGLPIPPHLWIRIMPIEGGHADMDAMVQPSNGNFELNGFDVGRYVLALIDSDRNQIACAHALDLSVRTEVHVIAEGEGCELTQTQLPQ